ncbi:MAG: helix-turn-helix domain-containing protein [Betaproteobacteria bacterium]|nr:helix-turn-helix domain-containing protein [Betaproteobacteria bacterium]
MRTQELGHEIRRARHARGLTQAQLARAAGLSRETLNLLESGLVRDLGIRKVLAVLDHLGLSVTLQQGMRPRRPDYVRMACTSANVSFKSALTEDELIHALVTGKVPAKRGSHLRTLLDEAPVALLQGLAEEAAGWTKPGKLERNLRKLANDLGVSRSVEGWLKTG